MSEKKPVVSEWSRINIDAIAIPDRLRALREDGIAELVASFKEVGQLNPITVRPKKGGSYVLIAGLRRVEAAKRCGWTSIYCIVKRDLDADKAELAEIDENLIRAELTPAERAMHVERRKKLYEKAHPETKHGGDRKSAGSRSQDENLKSFVADTAEKTGKGRSTVARDVTRANKVVVLDDIVGTPLDEGAELDALAKLPEAEQRELAERAKAGETVSAKHADKKIVPLADMATFTDAIRQLKDLLTKPGEMFVDAASAEDLVQIVDFLNRIISIKKARTGNDVDTEASAAERRAFYAATEAMTDAATEAMTDSPAQRILRREGLAS
jgi:ParB-like nuclease family protein